MNHKKEPPHYSDLLWKQQLIIKKYVLQIEECILESHAWKQDSPLWDAIRENNGVPVCEEVWFPVFFNEIIKKKKW